MPYILRYISQVVERTPSEVSEAAISRVLVQNTVLATTQSSLDATSSIPTREIIYTITAATIDLEFLLTLQNFMILIK